LKTSAACREPAPLFVRIESLAQPFDKPVEVTLI